MEFKDFFKKATGYEPYSYQEKLAVEELPEFLCVPTGAGKTAAVIVSWLYRRHIKKEDLPRRLIYCLPMRTLVEQTHDVATEILEKLNYPEIPVNILMGGEDEAEWYLDPTAEQIIIGTQDMLISRALNRGYALSRFKWPIHFGLLNNDCFWVFDEVQLMGNTVATSTQLEAFRKEFGTLKKCRSLWLSATLEKEWFSTVDFKHYLPSYKLMELSFEDTSSPILSKRLGANKSLYKLDEDKPKAIAEHILREHQTGSLTLVICNQVKRAVNLYEEINKELKRMPSQEVKVILIHSHFRPTERKQKLESLKNEKDAIVISTQVVEAGIDISANILYTELAPYPSLIQRFGRLNRKGEFEDAKAYWLDLDQKSYLPYQAGEMEIARKILEKLEGESVAPRDLPKEKLNFSYNFVLRKSELLELFDTSPDILGTDLDVSRFIRDTDELNAYVFWREFEGIPQKDISAPVRNELCPAPLSELSLFLKEKTTFVWDLVEGRWEFFNLRKLRPGLVILVNNQDGGYEDEIGFNAKSNKPVKVLETNKIKLEDMQDDFYSQAGWWESLNSHALKTESEMKEIITNLNLDHKLKNALMLAARFHDLGKAHPIFQETMAKVSEKIGGDFNADEIWAKSPNANVRHSKRYFRHELVSALMMWQHKAVFKVDKEMFPLIIYLVASHHGKIRVSIKSLPAEMKTGALKGKRVALGVEEDSVVKELTLAGTVIPETILNLEPMEIGVISGNNWIDLSLELLEREGPFALAYLEALLRNADIKASRKEG